MSDMLPAADLEKLIEDNLGALKGYAKSLLPGRQGTYQATELFHDTYLKVKAYCEKYEGRTLSIALLFTSMQRIAIDRARKRVRRKGGNPGVEKQHMDAG